MGDRLHRYLVGFTDYAASVTGVEHHETTAGSHNFAIADRHTWSARPVEWPVEAAVKLDEPDTLPTVNDLPTIPTGMDV